MATSLTIPQKIKRGIPTQSDLPSLTSVDGRMLFEHTQRQYARACNRIIRQGQQGSHENQEVNGIR
jgi:hypothetical protein